MSNRSDLYLQVTGMRLLDINWSSPLLSSLQPEINLKFKKSFNVVTIIWLAIISDPIPLKQNILLIKEFLVESQPLGEFLLKQYCEDLRNLGGYFDPFKLWPYEGRLISAKDWAHLFAHISLIHVPATVEIEYEFIEDRVFYNPANSREICIAYSVPTDLCALGTYLGHVQQFMQSLADNRPDPDFLEWMEAHRFIYDQHLEALRERYARHRRAS